MGRIGAELNDRPPLIKVQYGPFESIGLATGKTWNCCNLSLFKMLGKMVRRRSVMEEPLRARYDCGLCGTAARVGLTPSSTSLH